MLPQNPLGKDLQQLYQSIEPYGELSISNCRKVVFTIVALAILIFSIYVNSFDCSWHFDDEPNITDNPNLHIKEITRENVKRAMFSDRNNPNVLYRPVACLSFALNHYFGGLDVFGYHLVNIFIHLISSIFLFLFIYHTLNLPSLKTKYASHSYSIALLATILWTINPVQTQAITYLVQRMASMAGMFYIMGMFFYLKARTPQTGCEKVLFLILCFVSFAMALGSKENAVILPLSIFLYEILLLQEITGQNLRKNLRLFFVLTGAILILGFIYIYIQGGNIFSFLNGYENRPFTLKQRLLTEPRIIIFYISLLLYPVPNRLSIAHSFQISTSLFDPISTVLSILFIAGAIGYAIYSAKKRPLFSFCILFFFLNHVIESTIFPLELIFEHRNYIPSMLFFVPVAIGFCKLLELYSIKKSMRHIISVFIVLLLIGFGHSTFMRNFTWKNEKSLWIDAVEKAPDQFRAHHNLGRYYQDHGYKEEAISEYKKVLESSVIHRRNEALVTFYNLGKIYSELKDFERAKSYYQKAIQINPYFFPAFSNLAAIYDKEGMPNLAHKYLTEAIMLNPDGPYANFNMGLYYLRNKQPEKAISHLNKSKREEGVTKDALLFFGIAYKQKGQFGRAVTYFRKAAKESSKKIEAHLHLAEIFSKISNQKMAQQEVNLAINLMMENEDLFYQIMDRLLGRADLINLQPSADLILPLISEACVDKSESLTEWNDYVEKRLEKDED